MCRRPSAELSVVRRSPPTGLVEEPRWPRRLAAILVLAVFVLPGFVTLLLRERSFAILGEQTPFERLLNALAYSGIVYAGLLLPALVLMRWTKEHVPIAVELRAAALG